MDATKTGQFSIGPNTRRRVQTRSFKLPLDRNLQRRNSHGDNYLFEVNVQLRFLDPGQYIQREIQKFRNR